MDRLGEALRPWRRARRAVGNEGTTLVEVVIATVLLGLMSAAVLGVLFSAQASSEDSRNRLAAANLAAREIDLVRQQFLATATGPVDVANAGVQTNPHPVPDTGPGARTAGQTSLIDGTEYTVTRSASWAITAGGASACEGGSTVSHPPLIVTVRVTWPHMGTTKPILSTASLAPERGRGLPATASFIAVAVKDAAGDPSPGRTVVVSSTSETRSALTDASGCAVVSVSPATGGTEYTANFPDAGYVDITGTPNPSRLIGQVLPSQLRSNVEMSLDVAGSITLRLTGAGVTDADVAGSVVSLFHAETSGSQITQHTMPGRELLVTNLWPSQYSAFFGTVQPSVFPATADLPPGGSAVLEVPFALADFTMLGAPTPATVLAAAAGGDCATGRVVDINAGRLPPGTWSFFAQSPAFGCVGGPASVAMQPGANGVILWEPATLTVTSAPVGQGAIWAAPSAVGGTCAVANAVKLADDGPTAGPVTLPPGDWYVYAMADAGGVPAGGTCRDAGLVAVPYGQVRTFAWTGSVSTVRVTNRPSSGDLIASTSSVNGCPSSPTLFSSGQANLAQGTWYVYSRTQSWQWVDWKWRLVETCTRGDGRGGGWPITIGWDPSYTMNWPNGAVTTP